MAALKKQKPDEKSRWMSRARKLSLEVKRYASFGYVTSLESWEKDDQRLMRAIDRLYDAQRSAGLTEDSELTAYRELLRAEWSATRNGAARLARADVYEGRAKTLRRAAEGDSGMKGYLDELKLARAKKQL